MLFKMLFYKFLYLKKKEKNHINIRFVFVLPVMLEKQTPDTLNKFERVKTRLITFKQVYIPLNTFFQT